MNDTEPYTTDAFWIKMAAKKLKNPLISEGYRKRLEAIYHEAWKRETKIDIGHQYPNERR